MEWVIIAPVLSEYSQSWFPSGHFLFNSVQKRQKLDPSVTAVPSAFVVSAASPVISEKES